MTKIVYNACFGGFGLSNEAIRRYAEITNTPVIEDHGYLFFVSERGVKYSDRDLKRDDPALVQVVEEMGDAADGWAAKLCIRELDSGTRYRIDEYDGSESVMTMDDYDWDVA